MGIREYDPAVTVHAADCEDAPAGLMVFPAVAVAQAHPHGRPHRCVDSAYMARNGDAVVEQVDYEPHDYVASTIRPADATRSLCRTCRGTHGEAPPATANPTLLIVRR